MSKPVFEFIDFVEKFPPVTMPITLGEDTHHVFNAENLPLPDALLAQYIFPYEPTPPDEYTEYMPCFAIDCDEPYIAVVWWRAGLGTYDYILATYTEKGEAIDRKIIAFTHLDGQQVRRAVATIDEELVIHIAEGSTADDDEYDATSSRTAQVEIAPDGKIR
jgi:hypothetical protein